MRTNGTAVRNIMTITIATGTTHDTNASMTTMENKRCMICFEDGTTADNPNGNFLIRTEACHHWTCRSCLETYLKHRENDRKATAVCPDPDCQVMIQADLAKEILGRAYTPKVWEKCSAAMTASATSRDKKKKEEELDNERAFAKWLSDNPVQQCEHCDAWISRVDGCEAMQCLCGYRFCWDCQMAADQCDCGWCISEFYDNIRRDEGMGRDLELATEEELANFAEFYQRKECSDDDE